MYFFFWLLFPLCLSLPFLALSLVVAHEDMQPYIFFFTKMRAQWHVDFSDQVDGSVEVGGHREKIQPGLGFREFRVEKGGCFKFHWECPCSLERSSVPRDLQKERPPQAQKAPQSGH